MLSLKIQFVFSNHFLFVCFLKHTKSIFLYIYLLPGLSTLLSVLLFHQSLMPSVIPSQAIRRKWPLRSAANATDQLSLKFIFIYTLRLNLLIFDAFCWLTFRRKRQVWASRVWPSGAEWQSSATKFCSTWVEIQSYFPCQITFCRTTGECFSLFTSCYDWQPAELKDQD